MSEQREILTRASTTPVDNRVSSPPPGTADSWFGRYIENLRPRLSETAIVILQDDTKYIVERCICTSDISSSDKRLRRGLVLGSVQSGKTGSMLGVSCLALDMGIDIIVILGGTRLALWKQTLERTLSELDQWSVVDDTARRARRTMLPSPMLLYRESENIPLKDIYYAPQSLVRRGLSTGRPMISVVMKESHHLMRFGSYLRNVLQPVLDAENRSLRMLVIDDEADDGSVMDANVERGLGPESEKLKQIPRHIAQLWAGSGPNYTTFHKNLTATYVGYTATPQANILQEDHNPLSPTDFVVALRTPFDHGPVGPPREPTFAEPLGLARYYTGGETFYRMLDKGPGRAIHCYTYPERAGFKTDDEHAKSIDEARFSMVEEAVCAYFVAVASSLLSSSKNTSVAYAHPPDSPVVMRELCPDPLSALIHPSSRKDDHFAAAEQLAAWSAGLDPNNYDPNSLRRDSDGRPILCAEGLRHRLEAEEEKWKVWVAEYELTRNRILAWAGSAPGVSISGSQWTEVRQILVNDVFPNVRLAVINSDPEADDRPQFGLTPTSDGRFSAPRDIFTIFISGNVISRGITLEGLITSVFQRSSSQPYADSQMQMQRWFGYRGKVLHWCKTFMFENQFQLFRAYHEADELLRREVVHAMNASPYKAPTPLILQGTNYLATGKIANLRNLPLCPGADPFVTVLEHEDFAPSNARVLAKLLDENQWAEIEVGRRLRGKIMTVPVDFVKVAEILEELRFTNHDPDPSDPLNSRWRALQSALGVADPLFRPPGIRDPLRLAVGPRNCPYSIAAYLRFWNEALHRGAKGLYPTDDYTTPWSLIDHRKYLEQAPKFYVGIRFGSSGSSSHPVLAEHGVKSMVRSSADGLAVATWGSRNPGSNPGAYLGDQLFDYHFHNISPPHVRAGEPTWRPRGHPGFILFHVIAAPESDRPDAVTVGLALPLGGPDHIAALRAVTEKK